MPIDRQVVVRPPRSAQNVIEVELERDRKLESAGAGGGTWQTYQLGPTFEGVGMHVDQIVGHLLLEERSSANISYRLGLEVSYDGLVFVAGGFVIPAQNNVGYTVSSAYTTRTDFARYFRFVLQLTDAGAVESAKFSVCVQLKLWT